MIKNSSDLEKIKTRFSTFLLNNHKDLFAPHQALPLRLEGGEQSPNKAILLLDKYYIRGNNSFIKFSVHFELEDSGLWEEKEFSIQFSHLNSKLFLKEGEHEIKAGDFHFRYDKVENPSDSHPKVHLQTFTKLKCPRYPISFIAHEFERNKVQSIAALIEILDIIEKQLMVDSASSTKKEIPSFISQAIN